jgi:2-oxoglutarate dehydrogenase E2 component (dihydrolipoamide succinyltransferase)
MDVTVPEIGESVTGGVLTSWLKSDGEQVSEGEDLFELETDKATLNVFSPGGGVLRVRAAEQTEVEVGQVVAVIEETAATAGDGRHGTKSTEPAAREVSGQRAAEPGKPDRETRKAEPAQEEPEQREPKTGQKEPAREEPGRRRAGTRTTPLAQALLERHGLSPDTVPGTGMDGRVTKEDVLQALEGRGERRERLSTLRRRMAESLLASVQNAAYVTTFNEVDMSRVIELRGEYGERFRQRHQSRLGFMSFFVRAACAALREYPVINARLDGDEIVYHDYYHIGIAVSTERGLVVPVIKDADTKSFDRIESEIGSFARRAGEKKLGIDELTGGTFTITNGGVFGSLLSTPLPNPPQSAILGMHAITPRPVAVEGEPVVRPMMYTALTYDHRIIEGREAVSFLRKVRELVEDPRRLLLDV